MRKVPNTVSGKEDPCIEHFGVNLNFKTQPFLSSCADLLLFIKLLHYAFHQSYASISHYYGILSKSKHIFAPEDSIWFYSSEPGWQSAPTYISQEAPSMTILSPQDHYQDTHIKVLGVIWETVKDTIRLKTLVPTSDRLKKDHFFGLSQNNSCDELVAEPHVQKWNYLKENWATLLFELPQRLPNGPFELHMFADDSNRAHSVIAHAKGDEKIFVISGKSRSCPLKGLTIPRLELLVVLTSLRITNPKPNS
uniref:Uncharacterized protein n=1 Tax=Ascaris lumbricoides TaxID=6252 RepID=A0A9J2Q1V6_ASCLU